MAFDYAKEKALNDAVNKMSREEEDEFNYLLHYLGMLNDCKRELPAITAIVWHKGLLYYSTEKLEASPVFGGKNMDRLCGHANDAKLAATTVRRALEELIDSEYAKTIKVTDAIVYPKGAQDEPAT